MPNKLKYYVNIARPDHWFKNFFMLPGIVLAIQYNQIVFDKAFVINLILAIISVCFIASANYVINEWLDAEFDKFHPVKKNRPSVIQGLKANWIYTEYVLIATIGLITAFQISMSYFYTSIFFLIMGFMYNVNPFRTKNKVYLDVISESINNPIRFCLGWFIISPMVFPPSSILISYWMGGAFLMGAKRFAEYRFINDSKVAGLYRESFKHYDEEKLLISTVFYAITSSFFLGAFLIKHRIELLLCFPLFAVLFTWYLKIAFKEDSPVQNPEKLYKEKKFMIFLVFLITFTIALVYIKIPFMQILIH